MLLVEGELKHYIGRLDGIRVIAELFRVCYTS